MNTQEAKEFANKRFHELGVQFPSYGNNHKVNIIIADLRNNHNFTVTTFSTQHNGWVPIKTVEFAETAGVMTYNV